MPAITVQYQGASDSEMKEFVARQIGIDPPANNTQVTAYWRTRIAGELKSYSQNKARTTAAGAVPDPDIT